MNDNSIQIKNLSKAYGKKQVLKNISLSISNGMFGLLGRNGAGKTTLMKTITTLLKKQSGEITVCGIPVEQAHEIRSIVGYLPQDFNIYNSMSVTEVLDYLGVLSGMTSTQRKQRIQVLLEQVNLSEQKNKRVHALSGGMKQRLGIAGALLHDPKVLIVDEPTAGLDPEERVRFRNLLSELSENKTVLLSTHIVGDIEATCENIAILENSQLLYNGTVSELCSLATGNVYSAEISQKDLPKLRSAYTVTATTPQGKNSIVRFLSPNTIPQIGSQAEPTAEDAYIYCLSKSTTIQGGLV